MFSVIDSYFISAFAEYITIRLNIPQYFPAMMVEKTKSVGYINLGNGMKTGPTGLSA